MSARKLACLIESGEGQESIQQLLEYGLRLLGWAYKKRDRDHTRFKEAANTVSESRRVRVRKFFSLRFEYFGLPQWQRCYLKVEGLKYGFQFPQRPVFIVGFLQFRCCCLQLGLPYWTSRPESAFLFSFWVGGILFRGSHHLFAISLSDNRQWLFSFCISLPSLYDQFKRSQKGEGTTDKLMLNRMKLFSTAFLCANDLSESMLWVNDHVAQLPSGIQALV